MIQEQTTSPPLPTISLPRLLLTGMAARISIDTGVQIFGPFLELIARGMGISIVTLGWLNSLRNLTGLTTPLVGVLADRIGYRTVMRLSLWVGGFGLLLFGGGTQLWLNALGMIVMGVGLFAFVPVFQAYLSARIPYERRAQALGILEYSWALAGIFGLSLAGLLISRYNWRAPFLVLGITVLASSILLSALPPATTAQSRSLRGSSLPPVSTWPSLLGSFLRFESNARSAWSAIFVTMLNVFATSHMGIVYGSWLTREYGFSAVQLGTAALVYGIVDLMGSILISLVGDRVGKYRSVLLSTIGSFIGYALLPFLNIGLVPALVGLALVRFTFETSMVSNISLLSEQVPQQRGKVLTITSSAVTVAVAISSITGPYAYSQFGVWGLGSVAAAATFVAVILLIRRVREPQHVERF